MLSPDFLGRLTGDARAPQPEGREGVIPPPKFLSLMLPGDDEEREFDEHLRRLALHWISRLAAPDDGSLRVSAVMGDVLARLLERLRAEDQVPRWQYQAQFYAYIGQMMRNHIIDVLRRREARDRNLPPEPGAEVDAVADRAMQARVTIHSLLTLEQALNDLAKDWGEFARLVIELRLMQEMDYRQIGEELGCSHETVRKEYNRAIRYLHKKLASSFPERLQEEPGEPPSK